MPIASKYILGPCAAESEEQVLQTARQISEQMQAFGSFIFRAGIWKPRTRPDTFQGVGVKGLPWLLRVKKELGLRIATEVATEEQVCATLQAGVDYLWIGARTSANPIAVQAIAQAIGRSAVRPLGVFVKNPVNEDAALWQGNIARIEQFSPVVAIHRGCGHRPCWKMAYTLMKARPNTPIFLDPSHLSGEAEKVVELSKKVVELDFAGYMIEVHHDPSHAQSDCAQQIRPQVLPTLFHQTAEHARLMDASQTELRWLRAIMDETDDQLWQTVLERMQVSREIGAWKKEHGMDIVQKERKQQLIARLEDWAQAHDLQPKTMVRIFEAIHDESVRQQTER